MALRGKRGFSLIEVLVASIVASVAVLGMVRLWSFSFNTTRSSDQQGVGYNVGRLALERIKMSGFDFTAEGTVVRYYDNEGKAESSVVKATSAYQLTVKVETDILAVHSQTGQVRPAPDSLRQVTVTVQRLEDSRNVFVGRTNLARSGL
jgi:uncharacterized protein (TIGR02598 family)